jgi:hypothetical protein
MSGRNFDVGASGLAQEAVEPVAFVFLDFKGDPQFIHSAVGIITWGGEDWAGIGSLGQIESVRDQLGLATSRLRLSLSPVAAEYLNESINENTWGRLCEVFIGNWDGAALTREPYLLMRGRMGAPEARIGGQDSSIGITIEDVRGMMDRVNGLRATILDHQAESAGDTFYEWLPKMMDHRFTFNGQRLGGSNASPQDIVDADTLDAMRPR